MDGVDRVSTGVAGIATVIALSLAMTGCARLDPAAPSGAPPSTHVPVITAPATSQHPTTSASPSDSPSATDQAACPPPATQFVMHAPGNGKTVALTFDDGPGPDDAQFAAILDQYHVHATFFETGAHIAAHPDQVRMLADHGNLIGGHGWDHRYPRQVRGGWTVSYLEDQFGRTRTELRSILGRPSCYVRPPGGFRNNVLATTATLGLTAVMWTTDSLDWQQPDKTTPQATARIVVRATAINGARHPIVLMHSAKASHEPDSRVSPYRGNTLAALPAIIEWYQQHGYRFVRLDGKS